MPVTLELEIKIDDNGAVTTVKRLGDEAEKTGKKAQGAFKGMTDEFTKFAAQAFAAEKIVTVLINSSKAAAEDERQMKQLTATVLGYTKGNQEAAAKVNDFIASLERTSGVADAKLRPAFQQLLSVTKDVEKSQQMLSFAADVYNKTGVDMNSVIDTTTRAMVSGQVRGTDPYAVSLKTAYEKTKDWSAALNTVQADLGTASGGAGTMAQQMDKVAVAFDNAGETLGGYINELLTVAMPALQMLGRFLGGIAGGFQMLGTVAGAVIANLMGQFEVMNAALHGNFSEAQRLFKQNAESTRDILVEGVEESAGTIKEWEAMFTLAGDTASTTAPKIGDVLGGSFQKQAGDTDAATKSMQEWIATSEALRAALIAREEETAVVSGQRRQGVIPESEMGGDVEMARPPLSLVPDTVTGYASAEEALRVHLETMRMIQSAHDTEEQGRLALISEQETLRINAELELKNQELISDAEFQRRKKEIEQWGAEERIKVKKWERQQKMDMAAQDLASMGQNLMALGAHNKKVFLLGKASAAAGAVVHMASGIAKALDNPWPLNLIAAAATAVAFAAQIANIASAKPPATGQAHDGQNIIPRTGSYNLEGGEMVVPAKFNPALIGMEGGGGGKTTTINIDASGAWFDSEERVAQLGDRLERAVARGQYERRVA